MHHIICDVWSQGLLYSDLAALYDEERSHRPAGLSVLPVQYADYAVWQRGYLSGEELERQFGYWRAQLDGAPPLLNLPLDKPRPPVETHAGASESLLLDKPLADRLKALARSSGCTPFVVLMAAFNVLLCRYSGEDDLVVGTPVTGRRHSELDGVIGFFLNTLGIRTDLSANPDFSELMERTKRTMMEAFAHQDLPFEKLVEELQPVRNRSHAPIFQALFVLNSLSPDESSWQDLEATSVEINFEGAKFDMQLSIAEQPGGMSANILYNKDLFEHTTIRRMLQHLRFLLEGIVADPARPVAELPMLDEVEERRVVREFNATAVDYPGTSVVALFEAQVIRTPDAIAVEFGSDRLSYNELNRRANILAQQLIAQGAGPGSLVGISVTRSADAPVAILAILKTGAAYVPIDPAYPPERVSYMLTDSRVRILLTQRALLDGLPEHEALTICIDEKDWPDGGAANPEVTITPGAAVYAIYTSGSTGQPKGVLLPNRALANLLRWQQSHPRLRERARTLQYASFSFDVSFQELFSTWQQGGTLVMIDDELRRDLPGLARYLAAAGIQRLFLPYAALQPLAECMLKQGLQEFGSIKDVIVAGEQLQITPALRELFSQLCSARLHNQYGPSETHVVTACTLDENAGRWPSLPPIGVPIANTQTYVLDEKLRPLPIGVPGELYLGGVQVAIGYWQRDELTAEKFIRDPFADDPAARLYRTGDRARFRPDGNLEYLGRTDDQVKWRGFRIEPGEIEAALATYESVQQAAVLLREDTPGDKRLIAYLVAEDRQTIDEQVIIAFAKKRLPDYMVPSAFVILDSMPLTPSGKIARRKLPLPTGARPAGARGALPSTPEQRALESLWKALLKVDAVSLDDNFFDLGGHSLLTIKLVHAIEEATGEQLSIADIFENPTIRELSVILEGVTWAQLEVEKPSAVSRLWAKLVGRA